MKNRFRISGIVRSSVLVLVFVYGCQKEVHTPSDKLFVTAQEALTAGDQARALQLLSESIELQPTAWAYFQRAQLHEEQGNDEPALQDCEAGLMLDPNYADLKWLVEELKKPKSKRFRGAAGSPPSATK